MNDRDIRKILLDRLNEAHEGEEGTLILEEMGLLEGASRVDVAVINGVMHAYEIKSERDTLERLPQQRDAYGLCFDHVTILVARKHLGATLAVVPGWWGIEVATPKGGKVHLESSRPHGENPRVEPATLVQLLWREEARRVLAERGIGRSLRAMRRHELWGLLVDSLPERELRATVREILKARGNWIIAKRRERDSDSRPSSSTTKDYQANLDWLLSAISLSPPS